MTERDEDNDFLRIADAPDKIGQHVNLIGIVVETGIPKMSQGSDYSLRMSIVDGFESCPKFSVQFFGERMEKLPQVRFAGDIIKLSCFEIKEYKENVYAMFDKKCCSFAIYEGKHSDSLIPYQSSSRVHHPTYTDKKFIEALRSIDYKFETEKYDSFSLEGIRKGEKFHLYCKVLHICETTKDETMLFVWDGKDTPSILIEAKLEDEMKNPLPLQLEKISLPRDVLDKFPPVGTILRVIVDQSVHKVGLRVLETGKWMKLINFEIDIYNGFWLGKIMHYSKLRYLPDNDQIVVEIQRMYDERVKSELGRMPLQCLHWPLNVTEADVPPDVPFDTLMNVLTHAKVKGKYRCVVRVVAARPWRVEDFRSRTGRIRLTLEDPTARIHAYLYDKEADMFFGGYRSVEVMTRMRNALLGVCESDAQRDPPWVECCIFMSKNRHFRIFATKMVGWD